MSKDVYILTESGPNLNLKEYIDKYLSMYSVEISDCMPQNIEEYRLVVLWNLRYIVKNLPSTRNVIVFHASDLPKGRGWAPIYNCLIEERDEYVLSAILAAPEVDAGDIVAKARFRIRKNDTAESLRRLDDEISVMLTAAILEKFTGRVIKGLPQCGDATYYSRRKPEDSRVDISKSLKDLVPHLRACGATHRAFFDWNGVRYRIQIDPEWPPEFPNDLRIVFAEDIVSW